MVKRAPHPRRTIVLSQTEFCLFQLALCSVRREAGRATNGGDKNRSECLYLMAVEFLGVPVTIPEEMWPKEGSEERQKEVWFRPYPDQAETIDIALETIKKTTGFEENSHAILYLCLHHLYSALVVLRDQLQMRAFEGEA